MTTDDQSRLDRSRDACRATALWRLLAGLQSPLRFMMSGAHPDDECAPMLAALHFRDGINLSYACSTRGEGGQNNLGPERGAELGALRTAEMEAACDILNMRMYWLSETPDDPITDWRLSKSGEETLAVWGHGRTLARMVHILRRDKPDMLCPTFLDVPGQHGHHRAMTRIAHEAFAAAADPAYPGSDLPPWRVAKLYLPAWSGAGRAYDDDLPPPPATVEIPGGGSDPFTGWSYALIGAQSHGQHRSQGMGHWPRAERDFPLHLAESHVGPDSAAISDNLPASFADLGLPRLEERIAALQGALADPAALAGLLRTALSEARAASAPPEHSHRLALAQTQLSRALALASGAVRPLGASEIWLRPGALAEVEGAEIALPESWQRQEEGFGPGPKTPPEDGYRDSYDPLVPPLPAMRIALPLEAGEAVSLWPLDRPVLADAARSVALEPASLLINRSTGARQATAQLRARHPAQGEIALGLPPGWQAEISAESIRLTLPEGSPEVQHALPITIAGAPAHEVRRIDYPHIRPTQSAAPARLTVAVVDVALPDHKIGYIGAGLDKAPARLAELGMDIVDLSDTPAPEQLADLGALLIGIHAFGFNAALAAQAPALHDWVRAGGNLVTLYHRPWDNWAPEATPPARLEIGQPSLRWRVTNKDAPVTFLAPEHPLLQGPNPIGPSDFDGWAKERGLYFAKSWDPAYEPLFAMADEGEAPLKGGLLTARIGKGRHSHAALNLHHQLDHMVPGAMRLLANLLAWRS